MGVPTIPFIKSMKNYHVKDIPNDILAGIVVAALTIPIALGYAQVAGLPAVYGLYGSILPLLAFALFTSSPTLVFGMDAAGSAITGSVLIGAGIAFQSPEALVMVPLISFFAGCWLVLFAVCKLGRFVSFVSAPVMGGFITGIAVSIMAGQLVQMTGCDFTHGEFTDSLADIFYGIAAGQWNWIAVALGVGTVVVLEVCKRSIPKVPMVLVILVGAIVAAHYVDMSAWGIASLGSIPAGLPGLFDLDKITPTQVEHALTMSLMVAAVVAIESILADNNFAQKDGYRINDNNEIAAFGVANFMSAITGASPASASVSRTAAAAQYKAKSQIANMVAAACIVVVCLFCTPFLAELPMPILAGIVFSALCGVVEFGLAARLWRVSREEFWIFVIVLSSVLIVGIIFGVAVGVVLSFFLLIKKTINPPRYFIGVVPETGGMAPVREDSQAVPVQNIVLYRFAGSMFFANSRMVQNEIDAEVKPETQAIFFDMSMVSSIDISAGDRLVSLIDGYEKKDIPFYLIGVSDELREQVTRFELALHGDEQPHYAPSIVGALQKSGLRITLDPRTPEEEERIKDTALVNNIADQSEPGQDDANIAWGISPAVVRPRRSTPPSAE